MAWSVADKLAVWALLLLPALCQHRGYFVLRVLPVPKEESPFSESPKERYITDEFIVTAPTAPLQPLIIQQQPTISACPSKTSAVYDPSSVWLADWRLPTSPLDPGSRVIPPESFFNAARKLMNGVTTPILRSLNWRTRTFTWAYLEQDENSPRQLRVSSMILPDTTKSIKGTAEHSPDVTFAVVPGVGVAESIRLVYDPAEPGSGSPALQPNLTPPLGGGWAIGTLDSTASGQKPYFAACKSASEPEWHLFRNPADTPGPQDSRFNKLYTACHGVYIHLERVSDDKICFRWDLSTERNEQSLKSLAARRLFTVYHNSLSLSYPQIITRELDEVLLPTSQPPTQQQLGQPSLGELSPLQAGRGISQTDSVLSTINAVPEDMNSFAEGYREVIDRNTPAFGSTDNSGSGSGQGASGSLEGSRRSSNSPGLMEPDEIIIPEGTTIRLHRLTVPPLNIQGMMDNKPGSKYNTLNMQTINPKPNRAPRERLPNINTGTQGRAGNNRPVNPRPQLTVDTAFQIPSNQQQRLQPHAPTLRPGDSSITPSIITNARMRRPTDNRPTQGSNSPSSGLRKPTTRQSAGPGQKNGLNFNADSPTLSPIYPLGRPLGGSRTVKNDPRDSFFSPKASKNLVPSGMDARSGSGNDATSPSKPVRPRTGYRPIRDSTMAASRAGRLNARTGARPQNPSPDDSPTFRPESRAGVRPSKPSSLSGSPTTNRANSGFRSPGQGNPGPGTGSQSPLSPKTPSTATINKQTKVSFKDQNPKNVPKFDSHRGMLNYMRETQGLDRIPELEVKGISTVKSTKTKLGPNGGGNARGYPEIKITSGTARNVPVDDS
ncbi:hypothetical protein Dda_6760 [Drechslerella dactyloides]|uniref:Uncharacterized protein n=1 Tax=Drechslerella dactyloides TaxID=74499 RepID=A0AAD6IU55_DREDA|nr:hypothetical protein Dda_6760 [Drechslerella dactyloides]